MSSTRELICLAEICIWEASRVNTRSNLVERSLAAWRVAMLSPRLASGGTKSQEAVRLTHRIDAALKVVEVLVKCVAVQLHTRQLVDRRRRDPERLLQAFEDALAVPERWLYVSGSIASSANSPRHTN